MATPEQLIEVGFVIIKVAATIVAGLLLYIWKQHINEIRDHKKDLEAQKKAVAEAVKAPQLDEVKRNLGRELANVEARFARIEQVQREQVREIRDEFAERTRMLRDDMNGLGTRITKQIEVMGEVFEKQMAMIVAHNEAQQKLMFELTKALSEKKQN